jgi:2'-5' RNA ligase
MTPAFSYPEPQPEWPSWYSEYRYGAFYLFPPPDVMHRVNALRSHYDPPSAAICDAHVSLTVPLPRPLDVATLAHVTECLAAQPAFTVEWGPPRVYPGVPGVVLDIAPMERVSALVAALEGCPCFRGAAPRRYAFSPHMTIAEFVSEARTQEILAEVRELGLHGAWWCSEVVYAIPDAAFRFHERWRGRLGSQPGEG